MFEVTALKNKSSKVFFFILEKKKKKKLWKGKSNPCWKERCRSLRSGSVGLQSTRLLASFSKQVDSRASLNQKYANVSNSHVLSLSWLKIRCALVVLRTVGFSTVDWRLFDRTDLSFSELCWERLHRKRSIIKPLLS